VILANAEDVLAVRPHLVVCIREALALTGVFYVLLLRLTVTMQRVHGAECLPLKPPYKELLKSVYLYLLNIFLFLYLFLDRRS
jgi:hypothetical protein